MHKQARYADIPVSTRLDLATRELITEQMTYLKVGIIGGYKFLADLVGINFSDFKPGYVTCTVLYSLFVTSCSISGYKI